MTTDFNEKQNVAADHPVLTQRLKQAAIDWFNEAYRQYADSRLPLPVLPSMAN